MSNTPLKDLRPPRNLLRPMKKFDLALLEDSMEKVGQLTPIIVCDGQIVDGHRRWTVARRLGWPTIVTHEVEGDPDQLRIICQTRSTELTQAEKKSLLANRIHSNPDENAGDIAHAFNWPVAEVEQMAGLFYLIPQAAQLYHAGDLSLSDVWFLSRIREDFQDRVLNEDSDEPVADRAAALLREERAGRRGKIMTKPKTKSYAFISKEAENPTHAGPQLIACEAKTPMDGWNAALRWVLNQT